MVASAPFYEHLFDLHQRLLAGDPTLLSDVAEIALRPLIKMLRKRFKGVDDHILQEKAADALIEYGKKPQQAAAETGAGVMGFLVLRGASRVMNAIRSEKRRGEMEGRYAQGLLRGAGGNVVELRPGRGEHDSGRTESQLDPEEVDPDERVARIDEVLSSGRSVQDRQVLRLMLEGVRSTAEYARVLGIQELPLDQQRRIVKRHKDRLRVAAQRRQQAKGQPRRPRGRPRRGEAGDAE